MKKIMTIFAILPFLAQAQQIVADDQGNLYAIEDGVEEEDNTEETPVMLVNPQ